MIRRVYLGSHSGLLSTNKDDPRFDSFESVVPFVLETDAVAASPEEAPAAMEGDPLEAAEILKNLIDNIERGGMYSQESTLGFLSQAYYCLKPANPAATPAAPSAEMEQDDTATWPEWAESILTFIRSQSGYDGYDDASEGIDLPREVKEHVSELNNIIDRLTNEVAALAQPAPVQAGAQQAVAVTGEMIAAGMKAANVLDPVLATLYPNELTAVYQAMHAARPFAHATECTTCGALVVGVAEPFDAEEARKRGIDYFADRYPALKEALAAPTQAGAGDAKGGA